MGDGVKNIAVEEAIQDLKQRTLAEMPGEIARLVYLSSTRDYNTSQYHHAGMAFQFTEEVAREALETYHKELFHKLLFGSLEHLVYELQLYAGSARVPPAELLEVWKKLEPYRITIPLDCDPLAAELFFSNIRIALSILETRPEMNPAG